MGPQPETHVISLYLGLWAGPEIGVTSEVRLRWLEPRKQVYRVAPLDVVHFSADHLLLTRSR